MAPFTTATLPLQSCRIRRLLGAGSVQTKHRDRSRLRTAVEADAATGTGVAGVAGGMNAVGAQLRRQLQALGRAGLHAQPAPLALRYVDAYRTACFRHDLPRCGERAVVV